MANEPYEIRLIGDEKGKGLFACQSFKEGDTILQEKPLICCQFSWNAEYGYLACDNCLKPLENAEENARRLTDRPDLVLPFPECCETKKELITECDLCGTKYCNAECKEEAMERYHQTICLQTREKNISHPIIQLNQAWKQMHYPPETTSVMLLVRMVALINQVPSIKNTFSNFCHRTTNETHDIAHNLLGGKFDEQIDILRQMMQNALSIEHVPEWFTPDGFRSLLALVGTNGQGIGTSAFSRWVKNVSSLDLPKDQRIQVDKLIDRIYDDMEEVVGLFLNNEGSGLYVTQASVNHSCLPNASVEFSNSNSTLELRAIRDIKPGEEICISYLDECNLERSRHSRRKALSSLYLFVCQCEKCISQADDPDVTSDEDYDDETSN